MSDSLRPHESQHTRPPCPSQAPGVSSDSCPSSGWCHPAISSSVVPFSSCPQSLPASGSFQWVSSSHEVAKVLEFQLQHQSFQWTPAFPPKPLQAPCFQEVSWAACVSATRQLCAAPPVDAVCPHPAPSHGSAPSFMKESSLFPGHRSLLVCPSSGPLLLRPSLDLLLCLPCFCESAGQPQDLRFLHTHSPGEPVTRQTHCF